MNDRHQNVAQAIENAWQNKKPELLEKILPNQLKWYERPFSPALTSKKAVLEQWNNDLKNQEDIQVKVELLISDKNRGFHHFQAKWKDIKENKIYELDGVFYINLDTSGNISSFKQWWMAKD